MANEEKINAQVRESPTSPIINAEEVVEVHTSFPPVAINNPPSPSFFNINYLFSSRFLAPFSLSFFVQFVPEKPLTPSALMENPSSQLTLDN